MTIKKQATAEISGGYYIKARQIMRSDVQHQAPHVREVWDWLLSSANHQDRTVNGKIIARGQLHCTIAQIRQALSWQRGYIKQMYSQTECEFAIKWLRSNDMIRTRRTGRGLIITIVNYERYQNPENYVRQSEIKESVTAGATKSKSVTESGAAAHVNVLDGQSEPCIGHQSPEPDQSLDNSKEEIAQQEPANQSAQATANRTETDQKPNHTQEGTKKVLKKTTKENTLSVENRNQLKVFFVFEHWNAQEIIVHKKLTEKRKQKIRTHLKDNSLEEITQAIDNYSTFYKNPNDYYWNHKWTLIDFLDRGLRKFVNEAQPLDNFKAKDTVQKCPLSEPLIVKCAKCSHSWSYDSYKSFSCPKCEHFNDQYYRKNRHARPDIPHKKDGIFAYDLPYSEQLAAGCRQDQEEIKTLSDGLLRDVPALTKSQKEALDE